MELTTASHTCVYANCTNNRKNNKLTHFYKFPVSDQTRCNVWIQNSGNLKLLDLSEEQLQQKAICENHFSANCFRVNTVRKLLISNAVPNDYEQTSNPST